MLDQSAIFLVFDRRFKSTLVFPTAYFDFLIAILNIDAVDFVSVEIDYVLSLPLCLLRAQPLHFKEPEVSEASERNECQDEGIPPVHTKRAVATTPWFRSRREPAV